MALVFVSINYLLTHSQKKKSHILLEFELFHLAPAML